MAAVLQVDAADGVDVGFEGVEGAPLRFREVIEQVSRGGGGLVADEAGVDPLWEGDDSPSGDGDMNAVGVAVDEGAQDVREEKASVDEEGRRVRRCGGQSARAG